MNEVPQLQPIDLLTPASLRALVEQANSGNPWILERLRLTLDAHPEIWSRIGDLGAVVQASLISAIVGNNKLYGESLVRKAAAMLQSLLRPSPSAAEKLAAERVVACWLQVQQCDAACTHFTCTPPPRKSSSGANPSAKAMPVNSIETEPFSLRQASFWSKRQEQAHRRYESALKLLMTVQQMTPAGVTKRDAARPVEAAQHDLQHELDALAGTGPSKSAAAANPVPTQGRDTLPMTAEQSAAEHEAAPRNGKHVNRIAKPSTSHQVFVTSK
jgi:hypothetical protein